MLLLIHFFFLFTERLVFVQILVVWLYFKNLNTGEIFSIIIDFKMEH